MSLKMRIRRIGADIIDVLLCALISVLFSVLPAAAASGFHLSKSRLLILGVVMMYVFFIFKDVFDRSFGKRVFRLKIVKWSGEDSRLWAKIVRSITLLLFPIEFVMILGGFDTLGDTLAATCVVDENESGVPGMKKGNNVMRIITVLLLVVFIVSISAYFGIKRLVLIGTDGYSALSDYMSGDEIAQKYGVAPEWEVDGYEEIENGYTYNVTVNAEKMQITTLLVNDKWFVLGTQTETIESLVETIQKTVSDKTMYIALADLDRKGGPEIIEFCMGDGSDTVCNIYTLDGAPAGSFEYFNGSVGSTGTWKVYDDINGSEKMIVEYSSYSSLVSEKYTSIITTSGDAFELDEIFKEVYTTVESSALDENGEPVKTKTYAVEFYYNGRPLSPSDYNANRNNFNARYTLVSDSDLYIYRWQSGTDVYAQALEAATDLVSNGWD